MSVFAPRFYNEPSFNGLFRLLDDFDKYSSQSSTDDRVGRRQHLPTFTPKFDLKETETTYELHGDLPGINKDDVHLEFTNDHTLRISGKVERSYTSGDEETSNPKEGVVATEEKEKPTEVAKTSDADKQVSATPKTKYWVSERSIGEFSRSFSFPTHVNPEAISAKLEHGVLNVVVPKVSKPEGRRIAVQ
ncbi:hypothetical protein JX265_002620 [Neoarthrinium moseri]|uniref:SHSP domain-containing protein n=1 Tax=Neoarthrinium moseri TaxID=1658444 RepID=A0A9P9WVC6_9PEZI|nr:hypothetical protein JX265_002620 [Neoarthrinium moseri]